MHCPRKGRAAWLIARCISLSSWRRNVTRERWCMQPRPRQVSSVYLLHGRHRETGRHDGRARTRLIERGKSLSHYSRAAFCLLLFCSLIFTLWRCSSVSVENEHQFSVASRYTYKRLARVFQYSSLSRERVLNYPRKISVTILCVCVSMNGAYLSRCVWKLIFILRE